MKRKLIFKLITGSVITTTLFTGVPFKANGEWRQDGQGNYYFKEGNGYSSGWRKIDGNVYYFDDNGVMQKGWINFDGSWYYLDQYGVLKTGWIKFNNNWYYSDASGVMQTGIITVNNKTYYFADNGVMQTKNMIIDGQFYTIGNDGVIVGSRVPSADKIYDAFGNCIYSNSSNNASISPIESLNEQKLNDESEVGDYDAPTRKFKVTFRDYDGEEVDSKTVKEGNNLKTIDADSREGYEFIGWNTKSDGSGRSYDEGEKIRVTSDLNLYAIYEKEEEVTNVSSIDITGDKEVEVGKTVQLSANVKPSSATNTKVKWSVVNGTGEATIDENGLVTGTKTGSITVKATAEDKSGVESKGYVMNVVEAKNLVESIEVTGTASEITTDGGTLELTAKILPETASNQEVSWYFTDKDGNKVSCSKASIEGKLDSNGIPKATVTAIANTEGDPIYVVAMTKDGSGKVSKPYMISISGQTSKIERVSISAKNNIYNVSVGKELEMNATITPKDGLSEEQSKLKWSAVYITGEKAGEEVDFESNSNTQIILKGTNYKGDIQVTATSVINPKLYSSKTVHVVQNAQTVEIIAKDNDNNVISNTISTNPGVTSGPSVESKVNITTSAQVIALSAKLGPDDTNTKGVKWSLRNADEQNNDVLAVLSSTNELNPTLTAVKNGDVIVRATAVDDSKVYGELKVNITGQPIKATSININKITLKRTDLNNSVTTTDVTNLSDIEVFTDDVLEFEGSVDAQATNQNITWSTVVGKSLVEVQENSSNKYVIKATGKGAIRVMAAADNGEGKYVQKDINIIKKVERLSITSSKSDYVVAKGQEITLTATAYPEDADGKYIEWVIEDPATAGLAKGNNSFNNNSNIQKFVATKVGTTKVKVKHKTQDTWEEPITITVVPITETIELQSASDSIELAESESKQIDVKAIPNPTDAYDKFVWSVTPSNKYVTTSISSNGKLTVTRVGTIPQNYQIIVKASAMDGSGKTATKVINISNKTETSNTTQTTN